MPFAFVKQLNRTVSYSQSPPPGATAMPIGDYKRTVESHVAITYKLGGTLPFGSTLMEPILAAAQPAVILQAYVGINEAARRPYDLLYTDLLVTIIMTNGCSYGSLKKWLAQNQLIAGAQAYTSISNELVDMINTGTFPLDASKQKQKKGDEETIGVFIEVGEEPSSDDTLSVEYEPTDSEDSDSEDSDSLDASFSSAGEESHTLSESEEASVAPNTQSIMEHILAIIESGHEADGSKFDPDADVEEYYNECDHAFDDKIIGAVLAQVEPSYEEDNYDFIDHNYERFKDIYNMWCDGGPMAHEKAELNLNYPLVVISSKMFADTILTLRECTRLCQERRRDDQHQMHQTMKARKA